MANELFWQNPFLKFLWDHLPGVVVISIALMGLLIVLIYEISVLIKPGEAQQ